MSTGLGDHELQKDCHLTADVSCSHCKLIAVEGVYILSPAHLDPDQRQECEWGDDMRESFAFVASPTVLPDWIKERLEHSNWTKGKLYCQKCQLHIGSFNFTNEMKCLHCRQTFGSSIYFLCGNVSITYSNNNSISNPEIGSQPSGSEMLASQPIPCQQPPPPSSLPSSSSSSSGCNFGFHQNHSTSPFVNPPNVSPLHDPFHPESPTISTLNLATGDADTFDQNYDRICAELSLIIDPLHPDNLRISSDESLPHNLRPVRSSPNSLVSLGSNEAVADETDIILSRFLSDFDSDHLASPEFSSIRSCFPTSNVSAPSSSHQRRHSMSLSSFEAALSHVGSDHAHRNSSHGGVEATTTTSFFVSTHETTMNQLNRRIRRNADLAVSASNSPSSRRRPLGHPRMLQNSEEVQTSGTASYPSLSAEAGSNDSPNSSDEEIYSTDLAREHQCPICLDIMYYPVSCKPCHHKFCGFCLKTQACESVATTTKCAVCRSYIHHVVELNDLTAKLKECFSNAYRKRAKQIQSRNSSFSGTPSVANLDSLPFPGFHAGRNSYQICCCIAYIHASKHRKKYMAILQALLYFVVIGLPIFTLIIATVFSQ
ncbi:uncharacterized protein LOC142336063 [Convolutriloba macropyga]|uniref:uncharacterized protein LOC142336063 n=1 Tax=Convolutriloba macropyga TaxID=536237 RepID=UPI003F522534